MPGVFCNLLAFPKKVGLENSGQYDVRAVRKLCELYGITSIRVENIVCDEVSST